MEEILTGAKKAPEDHATGQSFLFGGMVENGCAVWGHSCKT